jgi:membrane associated rhomboid family serine protease
MKKQIEKLRLIYLPFLIIGLSIIGGYTFLNWLLNIKLQLFSFKEIVINFGIPAALPWIPIIIWLRPRIKLLNLKTKRNSDLPGLYIMLAGFAIIAPTFIAQEYLSTSTGKLTELESISQVSKTHELTKYYTLKDFYLDRSHSVEYVSVEVSGKHNEDLNFHMYFAVPILASATDTTNEECLAWYGIKFDDRISNRGNEAEKNAEYEKFIKQSIYEFKNKNLSQFIYLDRIGNSDTRDGYVAALKNNYKYKTNSKLILTPINEPFENRNGHKLGWIFGSFGIGMFVWLIMVLVPSFENKKLKEFKLGKPEKKSDIKILLAFFIPKKEFFITPILIDLNILIFIFMVFAGLGFLSFSSDDLINWGANYKPLTTDGEWWRLLTSTFLHGGIMHLFANMYGLLFVGIFLEPRIGRVKYAVIYIITGILASVSSLWWHDATVSVGASGAIFGLYGLFLALMLTKVYPKEFSKALLLGTLIFIGFNLIMGLTGGIDNAAHIGGLVSGFVIGILISPQLKVDSNLLIEEKNEQINQ